MENHEVPKDDVVEALVDEILGNAKDTTAETDKADTVTSAAPSGLLQNPELLAKLPVLLSALGTGDKKKAPDKQMALLFALKPYLGPKRCEAIDYISKVKGISDTLKHLGH